MQLTGDRFECRTCRFEDNTASEIGGAVHASGFGLQAFTGCTFERNLNIGFVSEITFVTIEESAFRDHPHGAVYAIKYDGSFYPHISTTEFCGNEPFDISGPYDGSGGNTFAESCVCTPDWNEDGTLDSRDIIAYINAWAAKDPDSDLTGDGVVDSRDVIAYLNLWAAGC
jgi:predicted outer membrane repeat protein